MGVRLTGSSALLAARLATYASSGIAVILLTRMLGPSGYGTYAAGGALAAIGLMLSYFGQEQLFLAGAINLRELRSRNLDATGVSFALLVAVCLAWPSVSEEVRLCGVLMGAGTLMTRLLLPYFLEPSSRLDFRRRAVRELFVLGSLPLAGVGLGVALGGTAVPFAAGFAVVGLLPLGIGLIRQPITGYVRASARRRLSQLVEGFPYAVSNALYLIYFQSDIAIVGALAPSAEVGLYSAACNVVSVAIVASSALMNDVMRTRLYKARHDSYQFQAVARRAGRGAFILGSILGASTVLAAPVIVSVLFGAAFDGAVNLLRILGVAITLYYWSNWASNVLLGAGNARIVARVQLILAVANVGLNVALVPRWGAQGSAWITAACEAVGLLVYAGLLANSGSLRSLNRVAPTAEA